MSIKKDATYELLEALLKSIQDTAPINIQFITQPISTILVTRVRSLEACYRNSRTYSFLIRKGIYPIVLFTVVTGSLGYGIQRTYSRSTKLVLNLLGVIYPTWRCWRLLKESSTEEVELKSWLTYWLIFGSFQVLDHWMTSDLFPFSRKKYNLYKLFILYWAQNPHSNGAQVLYRNVIQMPEKKELKERVLVNKEGTTVLFTQPVTPAEPEEEHTITIGYSYLDGYNPPNLLSSTQHTNNSSDDDDSIRESNNNTLHITNVPTTIKSDKEAYPLLHTTAEPAW